MDFPGPRPPQEEAEQSPTLAVCLDIKHEQCKSLSLEDTHRDGIHHSLDPTESGVTSVRGASAGLCVWALLWVPVWHLSGGVQCSAVGVAFLGVSVTLPLKTLCVHACAGTAGGHPGPHTVHM